MTQRYISILFLLLAIFVPALGSGKSHLLPPPAEHTALKPETLEYKVIFRWGLINKTAGRAVITLSKNHKHYNSQLTARSEPWADHFYKVRDTLNGRMDLTFRPLLYEKIANEGSERKHDVVEYNYDTPGIVKADCIRKVWKKGKPFIDETRTLETEHNAVDMLTSFYYLRTLPFGEWKKDEEIVVDIFSGKRKEKLTFVYHGIDEAEVNGIKEPAYHVTFRFTGKGGKKTSDDMDAWVSADARRVPVRLSGKLAVGKVHCELVNRK